MRRFMRTLMVVVTSIALLGGGWVLASNMGFRIKRTLLGPGDSATGTNWLGLPYKTKTGLNTAADLFVDLGGAAFVDSIAYYDPVSGNSSVYAGESADDFNLVSGRGVVVRMKATMDYEIFGSHDPGRVITLLGPEDSSSGTNHYAHPYNAISTTASQLLQEIGPDRALEVRRWQPESDSTLIYTGTIGSGPDFTLERGAAYQILVLRTVQFVPKTHF